MKNKAIKMVLLIIGIIATLVISVMLLYATNYIDHIGVTEIKEDVMINIMLVVSILWLLSVMKYDMIDDLKGK